MNSMVIFYSYVNVYQRVSIECHNYLLTISDDISITIWLFNIAMENPSYMEVYSWENHL